MAKPKTIYVSRSDLDAMQEDPEPWNLTRLEAHSLRSKLSTARRSVIKPEQESGRVVFFLREDNDPDLATGLASIVRILVPLNRIARGLMLGGGLTILISIAVLVLGLRYAAQGRPDTYVTTQGTVIGVIVDDSEDSLDHWDTDIRFTHSGSRFILRSTHGDGDTQIGDLVAVYYEPADPAGTAETDADRSQVVFVAVLLGAFGIGIGGLFFVAGFIPKPYGVALR